jgi:cell surface protein SprA
VVTAALLSAFANRAEARFFQQAPDTSRYPIQDRRGDPLSNPNRNPFDLKDTGFVKRQIEYDPKTGQYYVVEKIGNRYYRTPTMLTAEEFYRLQARKDEQAYFRQRANMLSNLNRRNFKPKFGFDKNWMNRITGNGKVEIRPSGFVDIMAGYQGQNIKNPTLPERARKFGGFDFQQNAQLQVDAKIGDKINLPINYNTLANFDFENQLKLDYNGKDDEILKQFQAGNVSFSSKGTLIPGAQSLFGIKTQLQFGKLFVSTVLANQRSQRQSLGLQGGSATQMFSIRADDYEENRHFLMAQYFRNTYDSALKDAPFIRSNAQVLRLEVWVTNRQGFAPNFNTAWGYRDVIGFMDMGEPRPFSPVLTGSLNFLPRNDANNLFALLRNANVRDASTAQSRLTGLGFQPVQDFEKTFARKLQPTDYIFNERLGYLSLNQPLQPDEVLGIAYQYTYNGKVYQVGEFSQDIAPDTSANATVQPVLFLKLLKATSQRTNLPIWDLMMKNVYSVGFGQLSRDDFRLDITYEEPSQGDKRYLPPADVIPSQKGLPILQQVRLDRLNNQNDPQPDGLFDYLEGITVVSSQSRIIFPVLEPFGENLRYVYPDPATASRYLFTPLYDTIKAIAQTYAQLNRFKLTGRSKSANNTDYQLGFNIPRGSVTVTAGGQVLQENIDYEINYDLGTLRIINGAIIQAGLPVQVQYENNATFGLQQRNYLGLRLDYLVNRHLTLGAAMVKLSERPFFVKQGYGEDPIRNTMYGFDFDYRNDVPRLTKWLNKLPFYSTKTMSTITAYGEVAMLKPGSARQIQLDGESTIYVDDFEGTRSNIDLRFPLINWTLASTPQNSPDGNNQIMFPEATRNNDLSYGQNRGKLAWYNIEPQLQERRNANNPLKDDLFELSKPETRQVLQNEIFPQRTNDLGQGLLTTFDLAYYPRERGPYNFRTTNLNPNGQFNDPRKSWGGIMRNIDQTDFETSNIEFIEFWVMNPFQNNRNPLGGELYINLGNISEDVLKDGKRQYENGLPAPTQSTLPTDPSVWGRVPRNPIQITNAFSNDPADRPFQDVGFDGLPDTAEQRQFQPYLNALSATLGATSPAVQRAQQDPSGDNFRGFRDPSYEQTKAGILQRYKDINNPHGNSPVAASNDQVTNAFTLYPDQEELNRDNTLNEVEEYFQYRIELRPGMDQTNNKYITDVRNVTVRPATGGTRLEKWYLFRIPVRDFQAKVGNIPDLKSIRFIRMFLTNFDDTAVLRFGKLELVRNQWRKFQYETNNTGNYVPLPQNDPVGVNILAVNLEENDQRVPVRYVQPPGIERQQQLSNNNVQLLLNEQSLSLRLSNLLKGDARGVIKTMNLDLRQYGRLLMFIHAEDMTKPGSNIKDDEINALVRIGNDFVSNYYEVKIPLKITQWGARDSLSIWPAANNLDFNLKTLTDLKVERNNSGTNASTYYSKQINGKTFGIIGNPNLGEVRGMFLGVENPGSGAINTEVWFNELRLSRLDEEGGYAAIGRVDIRLADLGNLSFAGSKRSIGFGTLEQRVNERSRETFEQYDINASLDLAKLTPRSLGLQIPVTATYSKTTSTPEYDPYDLDIKLKDKLESAGSKQDSIRRDAIDQTVIKSIVFSGVKKNKTNGKPVQPWDISNIDLNYSFTQQTRTNPIIELEDIKRTRAAIGYTYAPQPKFVEPFKKMIKSRSPWLALFRDFNFSYRPSLVSVKADVFRQFGVQRNRNVGSPFKLPENFNKFFTFDRYYSLRWELTRSLLLDFNAINNARIDEPFGHIDTKEKKDTVRRNFWRGGRNTHYHHDATLTYTLPMSKIPILDWTTVRATYTAKYDWIAASLIARELGNELQIGQTRNVTGEFDLDRLYNKWRLIQYANSDAPPPPPQPKQPDVKDSTGKKKKKEKDPNAVPNLNGVTKAFIRLATSLKRVGINYNEDMGTLLPGYLDSTRVLGMNIGNGNPGWRYILGYQPDTSDINALGARGLLTRNELFNSLIQQRFNQTLNITAQVSPLRDLNIDLNWTKTFDKNYSELYKDTGAGLQRFNPYATGSFSISYISFQTLFEEFDPNKISETFRRFENNRAVLSSRLKGLNLYASGNTQVNGYFEGYGRYAQDVLIPAFIAAYTNKDPNTVGLIKSSNPNQRANPFSSLVPKPNWNVTYNGLTRIPAVAKLFTNVTVRHGYNSTLSMNSFNTALLFQDPLRIGFPSFRDTTTGGEKNFIPYFLVPNVTISEAFQPLLGLDMTFTNQLSLRFEYKKSRMLSLSLVDYQLAENRMTEYSLGIDWRRRGVPIFKNIRIGKKGTKLDNDVTMRLDFSLRDDATANSKLDANTVFGTAGQKVIRINPSIDYVMNSRVNVKLYFEQNRTIPKIATTAPITTTRAGIQIRISLAQ